MSKYLANRGHEVTVFSFTGSHYLLLKKGNEIQEKEEIHEGVKFIWFKSLQFQNQRLPIRIVNWQWFNWQLKHFFLGYSGTAPDSLVFSIPALHQVRLMPLARKLFPDSKFIFEIQDIWPLSVQDLGGYSKNNFVIKRLKQAEKIAFENADEVIAVQPGIKQYVKDEFPKFPLKQVSFIPHAYTPEEVNPTEIEYDIGYAGTISRANDLETMIKALWILKNDKQFDPKVLIVGSGVYRDRLIKMASGLKNITFKSWLPREETLKEIAKCRICYDGLLDLGMYDYGFSRLKWVDYMMLRKPILASYSGADIDVPIVHIGWQVKAQTPSSLADKIMKILKTRNENSIIEKGDTGFQFLCKNRYINILGPQYEKLLLGK
jgi:glycosyltransferase involved in cell wall biosynthesis